MQFMSKLGLVGAWCVMMAMFQTSHAALTLSADENIRQEEIAGICMLASNGVYEIATDHQHGASKDKAKKNLAKEVKKLDKNFNNKDLVAFIEETWNHGLHVIYDMPVQETKEGKQAFISQAVNASFHACFNDLDG